MEPTPTPLSRAALSPFERRRRDFLKQVGAGALALPGIAGPFARAAQAAASSSSSSAEAPDQEAAAPRAAGLAADHFVPLDKKLDPKWVARLFERGASTVYSGERLAACAMPVGGIGCGQLYVGGDGTLRTWEIFHRDAFSGWGQHNYELEELPRVLEHGFAVAIRRDDGSWRVRRLRKEDVPDVTMKGEHPVAEFTYPAVDGGPDPFHVEAKLQVFAPFIPGNAPGSTLPATFFRVTLRTTVPGLKVVLLSWLENGVAPDTGDLFGARRSFDVRSGAKAGGRAWSELIARCTLPPPAAAPRETIVFADFEGDDWQGWKAEGDAFGAGPSHGTEKNQQTVSGFLGKGLVNSYHGDDARTGQLTSPEFTVARRYVNFLIGGGKSKETTLRLVVDGEVVASASGRDDERLTWASLDCAKWDGRTAHLEIVDAAKGGWGHVNVDQIEFSDAPRFGDGGPLETQGDFGTLHWIAWSDGVTAAFDSDGFLEQEAADALEPTHDGSATPNGAEPHGAPAWTKRANHPVGVLAFDAKLPFDAPKSFDFALAWHLPNAPNGHSYAARFADGTALAADLVEEGVRLMASTLAWKAAYYDASTLPHWLLERLHAPVSNLQTNVTQVWKSGRFWAWEGVGCCEGTCTHVWNYEHATGRLFPELARSTRELQDLGAGFHDDGLVGYRGVDVYAADGQCGTLLKCLREHQMATDDAFLRRNWPKIKKATEYLLKRDGNDDGLLEDDQHNTFDIRFYGANTFVGSLYLAALRAAEEMARLVGDGDFAARCRKVFESGSKQSVARLWNGEYFVQQVDLKAHPKDQYADGCLADQLFGQGWARQVGLGDLYPREMVKRALQSVWDYCWAPDVGPQIHRHVPERYFAREGEAGLFVCTWPKSQHLGDAGVRYRDEIWTGVEYQVAGHMVWEGLVTEALAIVRGIHERYDGRVHNPWNEVECGDHYARAMASVGVYLALLGFEFDGPAGRIGFAPALTPEAFQGAFPTPEGFGTFTQSRRSDVQEVTLEVATGSLYLVALRCAIPADWKEVRVTTRLRLFKDAERPSVQFPPPKTRLVDGRLEVKFAFPVQLFGVARVDTDAKRLHVSIARAS
jgi:uncharacterized protein (DUF608 family)